MNRLDFDQQFGRCFADADELVRESRFYEESPSDADVRHFESRVLPAVKNGAGWLLEPFRGHFPGVHSALLEANAEVVGNVEVAINTSPITPRMVIATNFLLYSDQVVRFRARTITHLPEAGLSGSQMIEHSVLPQWFARSWYWRAYSWQRKCVIDPAVGTYPRELPCDSAWGNPEWLMHDRKPAYQKKVLAVYRDYFGADDWIADFGQPSLRVLIDSACPVPGQPAAHGHQLLVHCGRTDGRLFHVIDRDFANLREIDPSLAQEALDNYFVTALFGDPTEFDFSKYSRPILQVKT